MRNSNVYFVLCTINNNCRAQRGFEARIYFHDVRTYVCTSVSAMLGNVAVTSYYKLRGRRVEPDAHTYSYNYRIIIIVLSWGSFILVIH